MWAPGLLLLLVSCLASAEYGWKAGTLYKYHIQGRTLTGHHQIADQYSGVLIRGELQVQADSDSQLTLQVDNAEYANIHQNLSGGWSSEVPESQLHYESLPIQKGTFQLRFKNGAIESLVVEEGIEQWQVNFFKSIASQFQVDSQAQNLKKSKINLIPQGEKSEEMAVYKVMEDSVNGIYETTYDISPLPTYLAQSMPELVPHPHLRGDGQIIDVVKTRNFSNSEQHIVYRYGASGHEGWQAGSNQMGNFLTRSSQSRIILSGNLKRYTIQSSVTTEKVLVAPHMYDSQKGIVVSRMNLTLASTTSSKASLPTITTPKVLKSLVYEYKEGTRRPEASNEDSSSSSSSSSENNSSSEEHMEMSKNSEIKDKKFNRIRRSLEQAAMKNSREGSSSSSSDSSSSSGSSSSSRSSSEEYLPSNPQSVNHAPQIEFQPGFMFGWGQQQVRIADEIKRVAREVGQWVQQPGQIPEDQKLAYFTILIRLVGAASTEQLEQATESLYYQEPQGEHKYGQQESQKYQAWLAFRDAVTESGTGPALVAMKQWVESGKVQGQEAASLFSVLPNTARYPNTEYMNYFFDFIKTDKVQNQRGLNTSAITAFAELVRKSQVDTEVSHNRYAVHLSGGKAEHKKTVEEQYLPYFQQQLQKAVKKGDSIKIQVYIRALGNMAHPKIMAVFEPYLEGKQQISHFQRLTMIAAFDELTRTHPNLARSVLYRVYQNTGEAHEIRVAAVMQLMKTNPSAQILQRMAEFTNYDHSHQVNAAVKSAIETAAQTSYGKGWNKELSENAKSAVHLLTPKYYAAQYSQNYIKSYIVREQDLQYQQELSYIQSYDSILPSSLMYNVKRQIGGYDRDYYQTYVMTSSAEALFGLLMDQYTPSEEQMKESKSSEESSDFFTYETIAKMMRFQTEEPLQVEGNFLVSLFGAKRFFTFDNHTIEQLPQVARELREKLRKGFSVEETKYFNQYSMEVGFPLAMGWPFVYSLEVPTLVSLQGNFQGQVEKEQSEHSEKYSLPIKAEISGDARVVYSAQTRGKMGFVTPFNNQRYVSGLEKNIHAYLPLKGSFKYDPKENKVQTSFQPLQEGSEEPQIFQYRSQVYTTSQKISEVKPYLHGENVQKVYAKPLRQHFQKTFGRDRTGYAFDVKVGGEQQFNTLSKFFNTIQRHDAISAFLFPVTENTQNEYISVRYNPQKSSPQEVKASISLISDEKEAKQSSRLVKKLRNAHVRSASSGLAEPSSNEHRQEELLKNVQAEIQDAKAHAIDAQVTFGSQGGYSFTVAHARSPVSPMSRILFYYNGKPVQSSEQTKPFEAALQFDIEDPETPLFNFREALQKDAATQVEGQIKMGQDLKSAAQISFKGKLERSQERTEFLRQHPISKACEEQMRKGDYIHPTCRNVTMNANYLNKYSFVFDYQDVPAEIKQAFYSAVSVASHYFFQHTTNKFQMEENSQQVQNQIQFQAQFEPDFHAVNFSIQTPSFETKFYKIRMNQYTIPLFVYHPRYNQLQLLAQKFYHSQPLGTAVLDGKTVTTFNNKTYPVDLGSCYHVFAVYAPREYYGQQQKQQQGQYKPQRNFAVLVKEQDSQHKEVQIILNKDVIQLKPSGSSGVQVQVNGQNIELSEKKVSRWSNSYNQLEAYATSDSVAVLYFPAQGIKLMYDSKRLQLSLPSHYRYRVRGLAGVYDTEESADFTAPDSRVLRNPLQFAASYALIEEASCKGPAKEWYSQAKSATGYQRSIIYGDVISEREAGREQEEKQEHKQRKNSNKRQYKNEMSLTELRTLTVEEGERTCFSTRPQLACSPIAKPTKKIQKTVDFHCIKTSSASKHWLQMIKSGAKPDFSQKGANRQISLNLPEDCEPKA